ncbi:3-isopropylmalate dehydratase, large subunit subfamily [Synechococcus sp. PCC 7335]|uniref:aconitase/3-isopropylmalate dehydratase large subunit family protein n=1 Tax=Synechococcus sp. (strain ATCC 29403 / PCC 7335) TaxID=91464 RepID=UPI00017ECA9F|nr:aconitase/3-isopropylmalate dehydratase large subunit family protein [Synechococcus sp. PCC 7335]EDX86033.1 3-isopropylmalate dehydratase, large subunit subfamily [Synechococcus sp. PCC 7335]
MTQQVLRLGDNINTDDIIPAKRGTNGDLDHLAHYALEHVIGPGNLLKYDVIEAGENFGCGSSREFAPIAIQAAGIQKVRAKSFAEIFYRNSINIGLPLEVIGKPLQNPAVEAIVAAGGLIAFNLQRRQGKVDIPQSQTLARPMTVAEKLLAQASGNSYVRPGEVVFAKVDLAMSHDAIAGPVGALFQQQFGPNATVWDPGKIVLVADHFIQVNDIRQDRGAISLHQQMVDFAKQQGCHLFDVVSPGEAAGICHVLLPEQGFVRPGMMIAGTDSHSCTYGAFGSFSTGVGTTDMANIFAMGDLWIRVPATLRIELSGKLPELVSAKDIMLFILGQIGCHGATGTVVEFAGSVVEQLPMDERMTLANMVIECGAMCGLMPVDQTTREYVKAHTNQPFTEVTADLDAQYEQSYRFDLSQLTPQVAAPPTPDRVVPVHELDGVAITRAFIGSCTGGKLHDLAAAAAAIKGQRVNPAVSLFVVPASQAVKEQAESMGYLSTLEQAGATVLKSGCGACINAGRGVLGAKETGIYATNRNFKGRSGDPTGRNYLASPRTVAISAVRGEISDQLP